MPPNHPGHTARKNEDKERVRDASDIVRIVGEHVALKARGREYVGLCPFHDDRKPSMTVVPAKQIFHCFVCQTGGDVFSFVEKYHKMEFREALEYLAERAGITLTRAERAASSSADDGDDFQHADTNQRAEPTRAELIRASATASAFFRTILKHPEHGRTARNIIERRAISPQMVDAFSLGAAPDRWDGLFLTIQKQGLDPRPFTRTGLLKRRDSDGSPYDAFRNRLIFPIHDPIGRIIAFGARKINEEDEPKYLNSPESPLFDKSATLYGLHQAAREIQRRRLAIITEGYTDTIACHQAGITHAVATLGTALTPRHASVLRRLCDTVILLFDGDDAGQRAADRAVEVFFAEDIDVKIATLASVTDAKDPDELLKREGGRELMEQALDKSVHLMDFRYRRIKARLRGAGMASLNRAVEEDLVRLVELGFNRVPLRRRMLIVKKIADITGLAEGTIAKSIPGGRRAHTHPAEQALPPQTRTLSTREHALACILCEPNLWQTLSDTQREELDPDLFERPETAAVAHAVFDLAPTPWSLGDLCTRLDSAAAQSAATELYMRMTALTDADPARIATYLSDCLHTLAFAPNPSPTDADSHETFDTPFAHIPPTEPVTRSLEAIRQRRAAMGDNRRAIPGTRSA